MLQTQQKSKHWQAFLLAGILATIIFVPFIIYDRGYFLFFGDFNVQQIPFYKLAHEAVRSGDIFWNWYTDLGANFIGSYSFYLITSPFFWLTLPFPTSFVPYLMGPLLILKTACAALTSYFYIQRFVKNKDYAVLGALLYAFSGFSIYNIFFNHFHEAIVFFPLLLVGLEELVQNNKRGYFAAAVAVNAFVNYWFFIGEVVFVVLYFFIRMTALDFKVTIKRFLWVAFEAVLGLLCAMMALLPSVLAIMGNPRTTADNLLSGWSFLLYGHEQRQPAIIESFFFPPDLPSRPNFFPDHGAKWSSLSAYLPLFSMAGVIAYLQCRKKDWMKKLLWTLFLFAMVPGLNSLFILLNNSYYTRWFYMLVLIMAVATVISLEQREKIDFVRGLRWVTVISAVFIIGIGLMPNKKDGEWRLGLMQYPDRFWIYALIAVLSIFLVYLILLKYNDHPKFTKITTTALSAMIVLYSMVYIGTGKLHSDDDQWIIQRAIEGREDITLPEDTFARVDVYDSMDNMAMFWHLPNIQCFHSIVPVSIMEFYPQVGVKRDVSSKPQEKYFALRSLLSVRWLFIEQNKQNQDPIYGFEYYGNQNGFNIYENQNYLPIGFAFDYYINEEEFTGTDVDYRSRLLMRALYLSDEDIEKHSDILSHLPDSELFDLTEEAFEQDVEDRRAQSCSTFEIDNRGFTTTIDLDRENLVFFSVPYEAGWSATVNGQEAEIIKADVGFMAVRCPEGTSEIRFHYFTPGLAPGLVISGAALAVLLVYFLYYRRLRKRADRLLPPVQEMERGNFGSHGDDTLQNPYMEKSRDGGTASMADESSQMLSDDRDVSVADLGEQGKEKD